MKDFHGIKFLVMDVDGTLTDGKIYMGPNGEIAKAFDIKDGYAIHEILPVVGIEPVIITGRKSPIVERRCQELNIKHLYQGVSNKLSALEKFCDVARTSLDSVVFVGDDLNDLKCMKAVQVNGGFAACPADAVDEIQATCDYVSSNNGGCGAVRDIIEWISRDHIYFDDERRDD